MAKPIQQAIQVVQQARAKIKELFTDPQHVQSLLEINANFDRIETRLTYMARILEPEKRESGNRMFPPLKTFMGKKLNIGQPLREEDLTPSESRKKEYLGKVEKLWEEIGEYSAQSLFENYRIDNDIMILRGVAKRAGVEEYETHEMTIAFIEEIQTAVEIKKDENEKQDQIDDATIKPKTLTQEDIDADPELKKLKAKPGDTVIMKNGKKKIVATPSE